ncbi:MAG: UvrB/UvrC motif-containing protein [Planctomycetota bacterium]
MLCQRCEKESATVHIDEVRHFVAPGHASNDITTHHMCEVCAQKSGLPSQQAQVKTTIDEVWKLLQLSAVKATKKKPTRSCDGCGTSLDELRRRGRVGCQRCYETFADYLDELLERMHGAGQHVGRLPGVDERAFERTRRLEELRASLSRAIAAEAFEEAARLRDELQRFEATTTASAAPGDAGPGKTTPGDAAAAERTV